MPMNFKTTHITPLIKKIVSRVIHVAIAYEKIMGRKLGVTGEIGEVLVCEKLKLKLLVDPINPGFDAINNKGTKFQIKTNRSKSENPGARIGTFSKHKFDYAILVILNRNYEITEIYKVDYKTLAPFIRRAPRRNPRISDFKKIAILEYSKK